MKTQNPHIQGLINYLEKKLCHEQRPIHKFKKVGPRTFFFEDDVDTVFVKVTDRNVIIITDGNNVIDNELSLIAPSSNGSDLTEDELYDRFLQQILSFF